MDSRLEQAKEWAWEVTAERIPDTSSGRAKLAAAKVIQSLPNEWIDADKLREAIEEARLLICDGEPEIILNDLAALLPAPRPRALADMNEDDRHALVGKDVKVEGWDSPAMLIAVHKEEGAVLGHSWINPWPFVEVCPLSELSPANGGDPTVAEHANVAPDQQGDSSEIPKSSLPSPEDVPEGEPWIMQYEGVEGIGCRNKPESTLSWLVIRRDEHQFDYCYDTDITLISRLVPEHKENA